MYKKKRQLIAAAFNPEGQLERVSQSNAYIVAMQAVFARIEIAILERKFPAIAERICNTCNQLPCKVRLSFVVMMAAAAAATTTVIAFFTAAVVMVFLVICRSKSNTCPEEGLHAPARLNVIEAIEENRPCLSVFPFMLVIVAIATAAVVVFFLIPMVIAHFDFSSSTSKGSRANGT